MRDAVDMQLYARGKDSGPLSITYTEHPQLLQLGHPNQRPWAIGRCGAVELGQERKEGQVREACQVLWIVLHDSYAAVDPIRPLFTDQPKCDRGLLLGLFPQGAEPARITSNIKLLLHGSSMNALGPTSRAIKSSCSLLQRCKWCHRTVPGTQKLAPDCKDHQRWQASI